jgi:hypothetical protein
MVLLVATGEWPGSLVKMVSCQGIEFNDQAAGFEGSALFYLRY